MRRSLLLIALVLPGVALASGGEAGGPPWSGIIFHAINLALFVGVVVWLTRNAIKDSLRSRAATIEENLEESNRLRREAQARFDEIDARLSRFETEFDQMRAEAGKASEREVEHIGERAEQEVAQIKAGAEKAIRDEVKAARSALHQRAVELAMNVAEEQLRNRITADDQDRLAQELLGSMKETNGHG